MRRNAAFATAIAVALALGGCSSGDEEEAAAELIITQASYAPIEAVRRIEIGRTRNGYAIEAIGIAPGLGYGAPELRVRREGQVGPDGFLDFDFVAQAPNPKLNLGVGAVEARVIRAYALVTPKDLRGIAGIRVHGVSGGVQMQF